MTQDFTQLQTWHKAKEFHKKLISIIAKFPHEEIYAMSSQLRRASLSISNNIAEGCYRNSNKEFFNFLNIALGSAGEVKNMIIVAKELGYIQEDTYKELLLEINIISKKINALMQKVSQVYQQPTTKNQQPKKTKFFSHQQPTTKNQQQNQQS